MHDKCFRPVLAHAEAIRPPALTLLCTPAALQLLTCQEPAARWNWTIFSVSGSCKASEKSSMMRGSCMQSSRAARGSIECHVYPTVQSRQHIIQRTHIRLP